jgi:signal transduction histidine kinase/CheY-like chemotaxis protein
MKKEKSPAGGAPELRGRAEARLREAKTKGGSALTETDSQRLVHELQVNRIELEMQNEELVQARVELEAALEEYTDLYDFAPVGYLTLGRDGAIRRVNLTGARLLGVERARLPGRRFGVFVGEADRSVFKAFLEKVIASQAKEVCEVAILGEGQEPLTMQITATVSQAGPECRFMMVDISKLRQAEEALLKANTELEQKVRERTFELAVKIDELGRANEELESRAKQLRLLAAELTRTEQRERKRLSQLLHDGLQQHLLAAKMRLGGVAELIDDVDLKKSAGDIEKIIGESVQLSRSLSTALSPPILHEAGLLEGLKWLIRWMRDQHNFIVELSIEHPTELSDDVKLLVFESVRELLLNAVKHSKVRSARVSLEQVKAAGLRITVSDEGAGFDPGQLKPAGEEGGFGLFSVRERISLIGGCVEIDSAPGKGSRVALTVPCGQAPAVSLPADRMRSLTAEPQESIAKDQGTTIRVLIADDHALFRNGIDRLLKNEPGLEVVGHATDGQEATELAQQLKPDVILMDISMPRVNGIEATRLIHREYPDIRIIGLSMYEDEERGQAMRDAGASDYKTKGCVTSELISAIRGSVVR